MPDSSNIAPHPNQSHPALSRLYTCIHPAYTLHEHLPPALEDHTSSTWHIQLSPMLDESCSLQQLPLQQVKL